jgi:N-acetylglucosaminyldiphosphoundecaprenol N-acetyl-beta-D-mannosaminyltransferase
MPLILERFSNFVVCGGTDSEVRHFCDKLLGNKHVIYQSSGYRTIDDLTVELNSVIDNYKYTEPLVMLLGLGSPKQELVSLDLNISNKNVTVFTVGGFISQYSSNPEYFPPLYDKFNIRFIYRLMNEPGHWKRFPAQFNGIFLFIKDWLWQKINADKGVNSHEIT